ncbi:MAG: GNAT family protein [Parcubacteria group bacterium]|jgi:RimJ/RimL family protein N-acetyltransferase
MILKGSKIYLQEGLREEDYSLILKGYTDLSVIGFVCFAKEAIKLKTNQEAKKFFHEIESEIVFGIYDLEGEFVGYTSLEKDKNGGYEFGIIILDKNYWSRGIGAEAIRLTLEYAFNNLGLSRVLLNVSEYHQKAIELYEKMGFKKTKLIPNDREIYLDGKWLRSGTVEMELYN